MKISTGISLVSLFKALSGGSSLPAPKIADMYIDVWNDGTYAFVPEGETPGAMQLPGYLPLVDGQTIPSYWTVVDPDGLIEVHPDRVNRLRLTMPGLYNIRYICETWYPEDLLSLNLWVDDGGNTLISQAKNLGDTVIPIPQVTLGDIFYVSQEMVDGTLDPQLGFANGSGIAIQAWTSFQEAPNVGNTAPIYQMHFRLECYPI